MLARAGTCGCFFLLVGANPVSAGGRQGGCGEARQAAEARHGGRGCGRHRGQPSCTRRPGEGGPRPRGPQRPRPQMADYYHETRRVAKAAKQRHAASVRRRDQRAEVAAATGADQVGMVGGARVLDAGPEDAPVPIHRHPSRLRRPRRPTPVRPPAPCTHSQVNAPIHALRVDGRPARLTVDRDAYDAAERQARGRGVGLASASSGRLGHWRRPAHTPPRSQPSNPSLLNTFTLGGPHPVAWPGGHPDRSL